MTLDANTITWLIILGIVSIAGLVAGNIRKHF